MSARRVSNTLTFSTVALQETSIRELWPRLPELTSALRVTESFPCSSVVSCVSTVLTALTAPMQRSLPSPSARLVTSCMPWVCLAVPTCHLHAMPLRC